MATLVIITPNRASLPKMLLSLWLIRKSTNCGYCTTKKRVRGKRKVYDTIAGSFKDLMKIRTCMLRVGYEVGALKVKGEIRKKPAKPKKQSD